MTGEGISSALPAERSRRRLRRLLVVGACAALALGLGGLVARPAEAAPGAWSPANPLNEARASHTATRLYGGNVLVAGGRGGSGPRASSELFNPSTGAWTATAGALTAARSAHTATLISGAFFQCADFMTSVDNCGKVLVAGGTGSSGPLASAELFDPATGTWQTTGALGTPRTNHTATLLSRGEPSATTNAARAGGEILVVGGLGPGGAALASTERFNPRTGTWRPAASLAAPRYDHTTTVLSDGRVLVAGGKDTGGAPLASAELYNPETNTWAAAGSLGSARSLHTATPLGDEVSGSSDRRVLVAGGAGAGGTPIASAEVYNPTTNSWTPVASLRAGRIAHTATVLPDGTLLVAGGSGTAGKLASAELFDPASGTWSPSGLLATARSSHSATFLLDGRVLVAGGAGTGDTPLASAEAYEPALGARWAPTGSLNQPRSGHTSTLLPDGDVLTVGGHTFFDAVSTYDITPLAGAERYDPLSGKWSATGALDRARSFHTATLLTGSSAQCGDRCGKVLVVGGLRSTAAPPSPATALASAELYDPATGSWTSAAPMANERYWHTATRLRDGRVLVAAGSDDANNLDTAEIYNPATNTWTPTGDLNAPPPNPPVDGSPPGARLKHTATLLDAAPCGDNCGKVLVVGGVDGTGTGPSLPTAELYDPATGTWQETARLAQSRQLHTETLLPNGKVLIAGGFHSPFAAIPPHLDAGELYNPVSEEWEPTGFMRNRRMFHTSTLLPDGTVLSAGGVAGGNAPGFPYIPGPALFSAELYAPGGNRWTGTRFMNSARVLHTATQLPSGPASSCGANCGKVLVAGGEREIVGNFPPYFRYSNPIGSAELYTVAGPAGPSQPAPPEQPVAPFAGCPAPIANVIRGTAAGDTITGSVRGDRIFAGTGNDTVDALAADDCVDLGTGDDRGQGGLGSDLILGGAGVDRLSGSSGNDRLRGNSGSDRIDAGRGNDRAFGDAGKDLIRSSFGNDRLHGVSGNDRLFGSRGRDAINGGSGNDLISAGSSNDRVAGDAGNDRINGNSGNDSIKGKSGNDRITGSTGRDRISGGSGKDRINARDGRGGDRISCGIGRDSVVADRGDRVTRSCERVRRGR